MGCRTYTEVVRATLTASNMAAQQMTFQAAVHDFIADYEKLEKKVKGLQGVVEGKERENAELTGMVEE